MRTYIDCYPCFLRQAIEASRMAGASQDQQHAIMVRALEILQESPRGATPPELGARIHQIVREITGSDDPYLKAKRKARETATTLLPKLRSLIASSGDPLDTAVRISIAGNIIDFGPNPDYDLWEVVERVLSQDYEIDDLNLLREELKTAKSIVFLGDNAGESVFDRLLIEVIEQPVIYVVRGGPVLNDTTMEDALSVGMNEIAEIVDNGARVPGTILSLCSSEFQAFFHSADLILAKGMGNYETLSDVPAPIFFLLQVKCPVIGKDIGAATGSIIVKKRSDEPGR